NGLLDFAKLEAGKMALCPQKTDLVAALEYYLSTVQSAAEARGLELGFRSSCGPCLFVSLDRHLFEKAFYNLLSNALKFTPRGGSIAVSLSCEGGDFLLSVRDSGIGIAADKLESIFERFNQVDPSSSRNYEGTGIGLSLTKDIVAIHGGSISVTSAPGQGSSFLLRMPIGEVSAEEQAEDIRSVRASMLSDLVPARHEGGGAATEAAAAGAGAAAAGSEADAAGAGADAAAAGAAGPAPMGPSEDGRARVLVVEDNPEMREYLGSILARDFRVETASDGIEGLEAARLRAPDIVVSDVMMPRMDGYRLCEELKADPATAELPVILLTARTETSMRLDGYRSGADDYVGKPFNAEVLVSKIRVFVTREEMRKRLEELAAELRASNEDLELRVRERTAKLEEQFYQILDSLATALEEKDHYTQGHSRRVERYSRLLAADLGLGEEDRHVLSVAASLHDIGKIGIPESILNKAGPLSSEEYELIKKHPEKGARILSPFSDLGRVIDVAVKHHERLDGRGYLGCAAADIPMLSRILSVADAFDAMTSSRAYRGAMTAAEALAEIARNKGSQFEGRVVEALAALLDRGGLEAEAEGRGAAEAGAD
ncbi:MAG TPA: HD domain-containing phosphohydrolase, partial [Rectinemataceae bacterium]|nr:HD domain-containing phosphohydrolase [Rectinemataceae bacterium]